MNSSRIDAHQHFWQYDPDKHPWITEDKTILKRDFMPQDLQPLLHSAGIDGCVAIQANQSEAENRFLLSLADNNSFIKGIVGWVDLMATDVDARLAYYTTFPKIKGFRHVIHDEPKLDFMLQPAFLNGLGRLKLYDFTYDILIFHQHLPNTQLVVSRFPEQRFVIDHIAKPAIKKQESKAWSTAIRAIAHAENVYCKISGMVTEADWTHWKKEDFTRYLDVLVEAFGTDRLMYGSDWPVCQLAASYVEQLGILEDYFSRFSLDDQQKILGLNASKFYKL